VLCLYGIGLLVVPTDIGGMFYRADLWIAEGIMLIPIIAFIYPDNENFVIVYTLSKRDRIMRDLAKFPTDEFL